MKMSAQNPYPFLTARIFCATTIFCDCFTAEGLAVIQFDITVFVKEMVNQCAHVMESLMIWRLTVSCALGF